MKNMQHTIDGANNGDTSNPVVQPHNHHQVPYQPRRISINLQCELETGPLENQIQEQIPPLLLVMIEHLFLSQNCMNPLHASLSLQCQNVVNESVKQSQCRIWPIMSSEIFVFSQHPPPLSVLMAIFQVNLG